MRVGYFDCFSGISGDMTLGALVDAGVDPRPIQEAVASLGLPGSVAFETVRKGGFRATHAKVEAAHEPVHRYWHHIEAIIEKSILSGHQKDLARQIFLKLGEAEARVHGISLARVHFHEVGAVDSIIDIVGSAVGLDHLGVDRFEASPVPPGKGWVKAAHGRMALPAPATAEILKGVPLAESLIEMEMTTPTGAAILTTVVERFGPLPPLTIDAIGLGAGTKDIPEQANVLRLILGTADISHSSDRIWVLESNLDDLPGEVVGYTTLKLMEAGALDAFLTPIQMKKNRPGVMISVLCNAGQIPAMEEILFRETTTLGIRRYEVSRHKLRREAVEVETPHGAIRGKLGWIEHRPPTFSPEYDDCARVASAKGIALREVYDAAHAAYKASHTTPEASAARPEPIRTSSHDSSPHDNHDHSHDHSH